jgi:hypothetical protein
MATAPPFGTWRRYGGPGQRHEVNPYAYLRDVLTRLAATPLSQLDQLLPDRRKAAQPSQAAEPPITLAD